MKNFELTNEMHEKEVLNFAEHPEVKQYLEDLLKTLENDKEKAEA